MYILGIIFLIFIAGIAITLVAFGLQYESFLIVFLNSLGAFTALFIWIFNLKYRLTRLQQKIDKGLESWVTD